VSNWQARNVGNIPVNVVVDIVGLILLSIVRLGKVDMKPDMIFLSIDAAPERSAIISLSEILPRSKLKVRQMHKNCHGFNEHFCVFIL